MEIINLALFLFTQYAFAMSCQTAIAPQRISKPAIFEGTLRIVEAFIKDSLSPYEFKFQRGSSPKLYLVSIKTVVITDRGSAIHIGDKDSNFFFMNEFDQNAWLDFHSRGEKALIPPLLLKALATRQTRERVRIITKSGEEEVGTIETIQLDKNSSLILINGKAFDLREIAQIEKAPVSQFLSDISRSEQIRNLGYFSIQHSTEIKKLVSIFTSKALNVGERNPYPATGIGMGANIHGKVFADLIKSERPKLESQIDTAHLVFDLSALDFAKFHISANGWTGYGNSNPHRDFFSDKPESIKQFLNGRFQFGEVVFYEDLPLHFLKAVYVAKSAREDIIRDLRANGIYSLRNIPIDKFIIGY